MAQVLVPFFRRYVDKDQVPDEEVEPGTEADRSGSAAQAEPEMIQAARTESHPPAPAVVDTDPSDARKE